MDGIKTSVRFEAGSTTRCGFLFGCYGVLGRRKNNKVTCVNREQDKAGNDKECQEQITNLIQKSSTKLKESSKVEELFTVCSNQRGVVRRRDLQYSASRDSPEGGQQVIEELGVKNKKKTVTFSDDVEIEFISHYDRASDRNYRTVKEKLDIARQLNKFKFFQMEVHPDSWKYTKFYSI